ncbi:MAG: peptidoglycan-binding protein [Kiloniellaceae bacterium]
MAAALSVAGCAQVQDTFRDAADGLDRVFGVESEQPAQSKPEEAEPLYQAGLAARARGAEEEAFERFLEAAQLGHGPAAYEVGRGYSDGTGTAQDADAGAKWINIAASLGEPRAQFMVGAAYYGGIGVERDYDRAVLFLAEAAAQGHAEAQYLLGEAYSNGRGVPANAAWAARWYGKAAAQGLSEAQYAYGVVHARGLGLPANRTVGYGWLLLAGRGGHEKADVVRRAIATKMAPEAIKRAEAWASRFRPQTEAPFVDSPTVMYVQQVLNTLGYDAGPVDGKPGPRTRRAVTKYQDKAGLQQRDGRISPDLIDRLLAEQSTES